MDENEPPKWLLAIFKLWWKLGYEWAKIRYRNLLLSIASMNDSEFLQSMDKLRGHPNMTVRAICSQRWSRVTWPNDHPLAHEEDARLVWERQRKQV